MAEENASDPIEKTKVGRPGGQTVLGHLQGFTLHGLEDGFERYGALVASHPLKVITACLVLTLSCGSGLYWFRAENEGQNIFLAEVLCNARSSSVGLLFANCVALKKTAANLLHSVIPVLRIRIRDPVPFLHKKPGWVKIQDPRSGMNIPDHIS
jgi:hypothetical protein